MIPLLFAVRFFTTREHPTRNRVRAHLPKVKVFALLNVRMTRVVMAIKNAVVAVLVDVSHQIFEKLMIQFFLFMNL